MREPLVSIIIPSYNAAAFLPEVLDSVFAQTYRHFEVIFVDDGSTDATPEILAPYRDRLLYIVQGNSGGPSRPRNVGLREAQGSLIAFCDADDPLKPRHLEEAVAVFRRHPEVDVVVSDFACVDEQGRLLKGSWLSTYQDFRGSLVTTDDPESHLVAGPDLYPHLLRHNFIGTPGVVLRSRALDRVGEFDESLPNAEDRDMWLRLARSGCVFAVLDRVHFVYRRHARGITARGWRLTQGLIRVLEKQQPHLRAVSDRKFVADQLHALRLGYAWRLRKNGEYDRALAIIQEALAEHRTLGSLRALLLTRLLKRLAH
jgi:glycosyltransferase involved in cell wall biosynthesis